MNELRERGASNMKRSSEGFVPFIAGTSHEWYVGKIIHKLDKLLRMLTSEAFVLLQSLL